MLETLEHARTEGFALRTSGTVDDARAQTTLCLAVKTDKGLTVGIAAARANDPEAGQIWSLLENWQADGSARCLQRARAWARRVRDRFVEIPLSTRAAPAPRGTAQELLAAIIEQPESNERRQIYADLLLEQGDPRGELIHVQLQREALDATDERQSALAEREVLLRTPLEEEWRARLADHFIHVEFRRGFIERATVHGAALFNGVERLLECEPVHHLRLIDLSPEDVPKLAMAPWLKRLTGLELHHLYRADRRRALNHEDVIRLFETDGLRQLKRLGFAGQHIEDMGAMVLARNLPVAVPKLEHLAVARDELTPVGVGTLVEAPWFQRLLTIDLSNNHLGAGGADLISSCVSPGRLRELDLGSNLLGDEGARFIAGSSRLTGLKTLGLYANHIGQIGAASLLDSPFLRGVKRFNVGGNRIGSVAAKRIAERSTP